MPQIYDPPQTTHDVNSRVKGLKKETIQYIPQTVAYFTAQAPGNRYDYYRRKPQHALNEVSSYVAQRESFAGVGGALFQARARVLGIQDPSARAVGMEFIDRLQAMPFERQQAVLAFLNGKAQLPENVGVYSLGGTPQIEQDIESLGIGGNLQVNNEGQLSIEDNLVGVDGETLAPGLASSSYYNALAHAFPELGLEIKDDTDTLDQVLMDVSDVQMEDLRTNQSLERLISTAEAKYKGEYTGSNWDMFKSLTIDVAGVFGESASRTAGQAGRAIGAEGIVDDAASAWGNVEQGLSDVLVGYYDPALGGRVDGLLNWGEYDKVQADHPEWTDEQINAEVDQISENRAEAFSLIMIYGGAALGIAAGPLGRRIKIIRSIISETEEGVARALPRVFKDKGGTGILDKAFEAYRAPGRRVVSAFDQAAIAHLRVSPEDFFKEAMFGRLYNGGGKKLLNALAAAKKAHPNDLDAQVAFLRAGAYRTTDMPDTLVRRMLQAPSAEDAKVAFVDYASRPQGQVVLNELARLRRNAEARLNNVTEEVVVGEANLEWNKKLARYNELNDPEATATREAILGPQEANGTGMDASDWKDLPENIRAQKIKAMEQEAELAGLRQELGFEPTTTDRFGENFVPSSEPPPNMTPRYTKVVSTPGGYFDLSSLPAVPEGKTRLFRGGDADGTWWTEDPSEAIEFAGDRDLTYIDIDADSLEWNRQLHPDSTMPAHWYNAHIGKNEGTKVTLKRVTPEGPGPGLPAEGTVVMMPTSEVDNLADPTLWDPETSQVRPPEFVDDTPPRMHRLTNTNNTADANDFLRRQRLETFEATADEAYGYHWGPAREFDSYRDRGVLPNTPEDARLPDDSANLYESMDERFPEASYWAATGEEAWNLLPTKSARDSMVFRVAKEKLEASPSGFGEELIARDAIPPEHIEYLGDDGAWHPLVGAKKAEGVSDAAAEVAALNTRQAIARFSTFDAYPNLGHGETLEDFMTLQFDGDMDAVRAAVDTAEDLGAGVKRIDAWNPESDGRFGKRIYYIENPDGTLGAVLTTDIRSYHNGTINEEYGNISLKAARGTAGRGKDLLEGLLKEMDPTPDDLLDILESNSISRKSAIAVHRLLKKMVQERTERIGKLTLKEYNRLKDDIAANGIREPLEISVNPRTGEAVASEGFHRWLIAKELGIEEVPVKIDYDESVVGPQFLKVAEKPPVKATDLQRIAHERLRVQEIDERMAATSPDMPMIHYPRYSHARAVLRAPSTRAERYLANVLKFAHAGPGQFFDLAKLVDELPSRPTMYVPGRTDNPADWKDRNTTTIDNVLRRAGVPPEEARAAIGRLSAQETAQEFYEVLEHEIFGDGGLVDRHLHPSIKADPELRNKLIFLHGRTPETRTRSVIRSSVEAGGGTTHVDIPILGRRVGNETIPLPSRPTEFLNEVALPNVDDLIEATSVVRRTVRNAEKVGVGKVNAAAPYNMAKLLMHLQTATLKPLVMLVRLPAMGMRIQLEQTLRMSLSGWRPFKGLPEGLTLFPGGIPIPFSAKLFGAATGTPLPRNVRVLQGMFGENGWNLIDPDPLYSGMSQLPPNLEIGGFLDENTESSAAVTYATGTAELKENPAKINNHHLEAHRKELEMAHSDWLDRKIAQVMDRERVKRYLTGTTRGREFMETQMRPQLERTDAFQNGASFDEIIDQWIDNRIEYLKQISGGDGDILNYIATGKLRVYGEPGDTLKFDPNGNQIAYEYAQLKNDIDNIHAELQERYARGDLWNSETTKQQYQALQEALRQRQAKLRRLTDEWGEEFNVTDIRAGDKKAFREELRRRWQDNPDTIPDRIMMEHGTFRRNPDVGLTEDLHRWAEAASSAMYRPFNALSYVDKHGTRGSLWSQAFERSYQKYRRFGYSETAAKHLAYSEAGGITRDLMYDLNARTSVQRALKDLFWFAPATQEVLYTWLVKIPSESYWPVGIVSMYTKAMLGKQLLKGLGILEEDQDGELIVRVPGAARVVEMLTGAVGSPLKVPDFVYGKAKGMNLVSTGGGVPGLSTAGNFILGRAALKWGGPFKAMSDVFQPYGPEATLLPQPITFLHEAIFGEAPPFEPLSHDYLKAQWDRSQDQALQYAYADLAEQGITPPRIEDFGHEEDGRIVLSKAEEDEYKAARDEYVADLFETGDQYARGIAWTRLMGSTVAPMSLYTTRGDRQAWDAFWNELTGGENGVELTDDQRQQINAYLKDNPNSLAYSVFTTKYGEKQRDLPFNESLDDAYFDAYYTGEASTLTPEEYSFKLMATESRRYYQAKLDTTLRAISPNLDPWELLRNANVRSNALTTYAEEWDRYKYLNPEAADLLEAQSRQWAETGAYPVKSFEAERLATTLTLMKQITPMLTGEEDVRPEELRVVQGQIAALYSDTGEFPEPTTATSKAMGWWYENVLSPYLDQTTVLYQQAEDLQTRGLDASGVYDKIRELSNTPPPSYKGRSVPSVEEYFWGNKTAAEREATKITWASRPITWLSDFQREQAGYNITDSGAKFLDDVAAFDDWFYTQLKEQDVAPSSNEWDEWQKFRDQRLQQAAEAAGPEAVQLLALNEAAPINRITNSGYGTGNSAFASVVNAAQYVHDTLEAEGYSPKSYSDRAIALKSWFYNEVNRLALSDQSVRDLLNGLSTSFPMDGGGYRQGVVLYEAVFFGNFNEDFIPEDLALLGG